MNTQGNILVVDDEPHIRILLSDILIGSGYNVVTSDNPIDGIEKLKQGNFDVITTDLVMPGTSGIDFVEAVLNYDMDMPIIMITAYPSIDVAIKALKQGAFDFISKPFNADHTRLVIKRAVEEGRLRRQNRALSERAGEGSKIHAINKILIGKVKELSDLYTLNEILQQPFTIEALFEKTIDIAISITEAENAGLWVVDKGSSSITLKATKGMERLLGNSLPLTEVRSINKVFIEKRYSLSQHETGCICGSNDFKHPLLCTPILIGGEVFAVLQLCKKFSGADFSANDVSLITNLTEKTSSRIETIALYENLVEKLMHGVTSLVMAIDARDNYTMSHCKRVTSYAIRLARCLGCSDGIVDALRFAGPIHDVGKIGVRDGILLKAGGLGSEEIMIMRNHAVIGDEIIKPLNLGVLERAVVRNHHERFDGTGYPDALKGSDVPLISRIFCIADSYDAMTSSRPYRPAMPHQKAVAELLKHKGTQFDGDIVDIFMKCGICKEESEAA